MNDKTAAQLLVAAFRAAAHASEDDVAIDQSRGAEQALAENRLDVALTFSNFGDLMVRLSIAAALEVRHG